MKLNEAIKILEEHNRWRNGDGVMQEPKKLTEAIEIAINILKPMI